MRFLIIVFLLTTSCAKMDYDLNPWTTVMRFIVNEKK